MLLENVQAMSLVLGIRVRFLFDVICIEGIDCLINWLSISRNMAMEEAPSINLSTSVSFLKIQNLWEVRKLNLSGCHVNCKSDGPV